MILSDTYMQGCLKSALMVTVHTTTLAMVAGGSGGRRKGHYNGRNSWNNPPPLNHRELDTTLYNLAKQWGFHNWSVAGKVLSSIRRRDRGLTGKDWRSPVIRKMTRRTAGNQLLLAVGASEFAAAGKEMDGWRDRQVETALGLPFFWCGTREEGTARWGGWWFKLKPDHLFHLWPKCYPSPYSLVAFTLYALTFQV